MASRINNIFWQSGDKLFKAFSNVIVMAIIAKYGPVIFGTFNFALSLATLVTIVAAIGNDSVVIREITVDFEARGIITGSAFALRLCIWVITAILYILYFLFSGFDGNQIHISFFLLFYSITSLSDVTDAEYQAQLKSKLSVLPRTIVQMGMLVLRVTLLLNKCSIIIIAATYALEGFVLMASVLFVYFKKYSLAQSWHIDKKYFLKLYNASKPLLAGTVATVLYMRIDQILLKKFSSPDQLGQFTMVNRIGESMYFIPVAIASSYMSLLVKEHIVSTIDFTKAFTKYISVMMFVCIICAVTIYTVGWLAITYYFGKDYFEARSILMIYAWCIFPLGVNLANNQYLIVLNRERVVFMRYFLGFIMNLILNLLLIPKYGALGAASATFTSLIFINFFSNLFVPTLFPLFKAQVKGLIYIPVLVKGFLMNKLKR